MDAVVIAGGTPQPGEPLYTYTAGTGKSLLDISGKPMVQWVLEALEGSSRIDRIVIVGLEPHVGINSSRLAAYLPDHGGILENIRAGVMKIREINPSAEFAAIASSDIPAILPEHVDWVVETALQHSGDIFYNVITRGVMEKRFPGSNRSYVALKDMDVCGGDLNVIRVAAVTENDGIWKKLVDARKNALKQAALIGYDSLVLLLLRRLTLQAAIERVSRRINLDGCALVCPHAEIAMDVDKPHQLEIIRADLSSRGRS